METLEAISRRRSVKHFDPNHTFSELEIRTLLESAMLSPTAFNIQHWRFVLVQNRELRQAIRAVAWNQAQVTDASLLIVLCADLRAWKKQPERYWRLASPEAQATVLPAIHHYYEGREQVQRDETMRSCGIAAQTLMLAAKGMGYDSCAMAGFDFDAVGRLVHLPKEHLISMMVAVGRPLRPASSRSGPLDWEEVVIQDRFPDEDLDDEAPK